MARTRKTRTEIVGELQPLTDFIRCQSKEARTRGPDLDAPLNRPTIETPGFGTKKDRRTIRDLLGEHRLEMLREAKEFGLGAATDFEIAEHFGVSPNTIAYWRRRDPSFDSALTLGDDIASGRVKASLFHLANGYSYRSEKIFQHEGVPVRVPVIEHVPPNMTAIVWWQKNVDGWRDVQHVEGNVDVNVKVDPRASAMAILSSLRAALATPQGVTIDHEPATVEATE